MCGRFVSRADAAAEREWDITRSWSHKQVSYNVAPTQNVPVIVGDDGARAGAFMRWGLIPFFAKGEAGKYSTINARIEGIRKSAAYRGPWRHGQRCVVPALGFYEWQERPGRGKQPWFIQRSDARQLGMAGLWDRSDSPDGHSITSFTIITMPANELVGKLHAKQRMPAILQDDAVDAWLSGSIEDAEAVLYPYPAALMRAHPVSPRVNSPKNDDETLINPVAEEAN